MVAHSETRALILETFSGIDKCPRELCRMQPKAWLNPAPVELRDSTSRHSLVCRKSTRRCYCSRVVACCSCSDAGKVPPHSPKNQAKQVRLKMKGLLTWHGPMIFPGT